MKKIFVSLFLVLFLPAIAEDTVSINGMDEPQWKDFTPPAYIDVKSPKGLGKFNDTAAYWYKRKVEFENEILKCREIENVDSKISCYQDLKVKQYQKNSDYNARLEAIENAKLGPQEFQNPTSNMLPIGGLLDNFTRFQPNELH